LKSATCGKGIKEAQHFAGLYHFFPIHALIGSIPEIGGQVQVFDHSIT
jgi:hypothetical protein